jgi:uncharacterized protein YbjT (DUF2867 family)
MDRTDKTIAVTGATGQQGGAVARCLLRDGWEVRALTRDPDRPAARELAQDGAQVVRCDMHDPAALERALTGAYGCFSVQAVNPGEVEQGMNVAEASLAAGISHCVYTSVCAADQETEIPFFDSKNEIEQYMRSLHLPLTILRPVFFMENLTRPEVCENVLNGKLTLPLRPDVPLQMVAVDDIGAIAAIVFDNPSKYLDAILDLAGDSITMVQAAEALTRVLGRRIRYQQIPTSAIPDPGMRKLFDYLNEKGFEVSIPDVRRILPDLLSFERWLTQCRYADTLAATHSGARRM